MNNNNNNPEDFKGHSPLSSWTSCSSPLTLVERNEKKRPLFVVGDIVKTHIKGQTGMPYIVCSVTNDAIGVTNLKDIKHYCSTVRPPSYFTLHNHFYFNGDRDVETIVPMLAGLQGTAVPAPTNLDDITFLKKLSMTWLGPFQMNLSFYGKYEKPRFPHEIFSLPDIKMTYSTYNIWYNKICAHNAVPIIQHVLNWTVEKKSLLLELDDNDQIKYTQGYPYKRESEFSSHITKIEIQFLVLFTSYSNCQLIYDLQKLKVGGGGAAPLPTPSISSFETILPTPSENYVDNYQEIKDQINQEGCKGHSSLQLRNYQLDDIAFMIKQESSPSSLLSPLFHIEPCYKKNNLNCKPIYYQPCFQFTKITTHLPDIRGGWLADKGGMGKRTTILSYIAWDLKQSPKTTSLFLISDAQILSWKSACESILDPLGIKYDFNNEWKSEFHPIIGDNTTIKKKRKPLLYFVSKLNLVQKISNAEHLFLLNTKKWKRVIIEDGFILKPTNKINKILNLLPLNVYRWVLISEVKSAANWQDWMGQLYFLNIMFLFNDDQISKFNFEMKELTAEKNISIQTFIEERDCVPSNPLSIVNNNIDQGGWKGLRPFLMFWQDLFKYNIIRHEPEQKLGDMCPLLTIKPPNIEIISIPWIDDIEKVSYDVLYNFYQSKYQEYQTSVKNKIQIKNNQDKVGYKRNNLNIFQDNDEDNIKAKKCLPPNQIMKSLLEAINGGLFIDIFHMHTEHAIHVSVQNYLKEDGISYYAEFENKIFTNKVDAETMDDDILNNNCPICSNIINIPLITWCGHIYCKECIQKYFGNQFNSAATKQCPVCRNPLGYNDFYRPCTKDITTTIVKKLKIDSTPNDIILKNEIKEDDPISIKMEIEEYNLEIEQQSASIFKKKNIKLDLEKHLNVQCVTKIAYVVNLLKSYSKKMKTKNITVQRIIIVSHFPLVLKTLYKQLEAYNKYGNENRSNILNSLKLNSNNIISDETFVNTYVSWSGATFITSKQPLNILFWCSRNGMLPRAVLNNIQQVWFIEPNSNPEMALAWYNMLKVIDSPVITIKQFILQDTIESKLVDWYINNREKQDSSFSITFKCPSELLNQLFEEKGASPLSTTACGAL